MKTIANKKRGYTIIETMISVSLFIVIVMAGMNALLNANLLHQKSQSMRSLIDNLSFVMEDMSRNMRTGYNFHCFILNVDNISPSTDPSISNPKSCTKGWAIAFESASGDTLNYDDQWLYYVNNGKIFKATIGPYAPAAFVQMTPDEVVISSVEPFSVLGAESVANSDKQQPLIGIKLVGTITIKNVVTPFSLQTSVSQRVIDI